MYRIGSDEHKERFCRSFIDSHMMYEPEQLAWPQLDERSLDFLRSIPVWTSALEVEHNAGVLLRAFAAQQNDALVREALELQGYEEDRHGRMVRTLIERYGLTVGAVAVAGNPTRRDFLTFGYGECLDSFFGFGIYKIACDLKVVSEKLTDIFSRVLVEEARHIVFFVNWIAYDRARRGLSYPLLQALPALLGYLGAIRKTLGRTKAVDKEDRGMTLVGEVFAGVTLTQFLRTAIAENDRYMSAFDRNLLRPTLIPLIARAALSLSELGASLRRNAAVKEYR